MTVVSETQSRDSTRDVAGSQWQLGLCTICISSSGISMVSIMASLSFIRVSYFVKFRTRRLSCTKYISDWRYLSALGSITQRMNTFKRRTNPCIEALSTIVTKGEFARIGHLNMIWLVLWHPGKRHTVGHDIPMRLPAVKRLICTRLKSEVRGLGCDTITVRCDAMRCGGVEFRNCNRLQLQLFFM